MNRMRLRIAERLKQSQNTAASLTTFNEVDMSSLMEFRKLYKDEVLKKTGVKLGFMSAFSRACILAMKDIPAVNASIDGPGSGDTIIYRDYVDISVAVATEKGLVTPVVRNAESLDLVGVERAIAELGKKVRWTWRHSPPERIERELTWDLSALRLVTTSSRSRTWPAGHSPLATYALSLPSQVSSVRGALPGMCANDPLIDRAVSSARSWERPS